jgi:dTDP-4-dehydrorhamnose 3,5-epimerase
MTAEYDGSDEYGIAWNDPALNLAWQLEDPVVSEKDAGNPPLEWAQIPTFD